MNSVIARICIYIGGATFAISAELVIPAERMPATGTYQAAGLGFDLTQSYVAAKTVHSTINATGTTADRRNDIQTAINALPEFTGLQLGPGDFYISSAVGFSYQQQNRYLIGSVDATGKPTTRLIPTDGQVAVQLGTNFAFNASTTGVPATFTKGATTLQVADSSAFFVNRLARIEVANEAATPVVSIYGYEYVRGQLVMVTDKPDSTHITIAAPGLHYDFSGASAIRITHEENGFISKGNGVANIIVDVTQHVDYGSGLLFNGIAIENSYQSWIYNCHVLRTGNYGFYLNSGFNCQLERVWAQGEDNGSSTAGIFVSYSAQCIISDWVVCDQQYAVLNQYSNSGNVWSYGVAVPGDPLRNPSGISQFSVNHAPAGQGTLVEGVHVVFAMNDGYFGSTINTNWFRNRIVGALALKRFSRDENSIGNIHGSTGVDGGGNSLGDPFIGSSISTGTVSMRGALSTLTTRTSATEGTATVPSGHGITTGSTVSVYWSQLEGGYKISKIRRDVTVGTVAGASVSFSGGSGDDLPAQDAEIYVTMSNPSLYDYSIDWDVANGRTKRWPGTLTTKTSDYAGVVTLNTGLGASLQASIDAAGGDITRGMWPGAVGASGLIGFMNITNIAGDVVTFDNSNQAFVPAEGTTVTIVPSPQNVPEKDLDVILTLYARMNYYGRATGSGIPSYEDVSPATLPASLYRTTAPAAFTEAGLTWPPYDPTSPNFSYTALPAGVAYDNGWWVSDPNTVATPQFSPAPGTHASGTALTITSSTSAATIYVTLDGSTPTTSSTLYTGPISLPDGTTVVKAIAVKAEMTDSAVQSGTYTLVTAPAAPSGLGATATSASQINLAWTDNSSTETGFRIERRVGAGSWSTVTTAAANATSYSNTGLTASTTYEYRVFALNVAGDSAASNTASATTQSEGGGGGGGAANATVNQLTIQTLVIP